MRGERGASEGLARVRGTDQGGREVTASAKIDCREWGGWCVRICLDGVLTALRLWENPKHLLLPPLMMWYDISAFRIYALPGRKVESAGVFSVSHFSPLCHHNLSQSNQDFLGLMPFTHRRTVRSWSFLFQPSIRKQFLIILRASRRHTRSACARQLMAVERAAAGIPIIYITFRVDCRCHQYCYHYQFASMSRKGR